MKTRRSRADTGVANIALEARVLLSSGSVWTVLGDLSPRRPSDSIVVDVDPKNAALLRARVNGHLVGTRALSGLQSIEIGAGRGNDRISVELGKAGANIAVRAWGSIGDDTLTGDSGNQEFHGGAGDDSVDAQGGNDTVYGDAGDDNLAGGDDADWIEGDGGNDTLAGGWGTDRLFGEAGADDLSGGEDRDKLEGGDGTDVVEGDGGRDAINGGRGQDWLYYEKSIDGVQTDGLDRLRGENTALPLERLPIAHVRELIREQALARWDAVFGQEVTWNPYLTPGGKGRISFDTDVVMGSPVELAGGVSSPNVQVQGVAEADLVQNDNRYLYALIGQDLVITDSNTDALVHRKTLPGTPIGLYVFENRLTVISWDHSNQVKPMPVDGTLRTMPWYVWDQKIRVTVYDVTNRAAPTQVEETKLDGSYVSSRAFGDRVYIIVQNSLEAPAPLTTSTGPDSLLYETRQAYLARLEAGLLDDTLPGFQTTAAGKTSSGVLLGSDLWTQTPDQILGQSTLSVALIDVGDNQADPVAATSIVGWGGEVYASTDALYLSQPTWTNEQQQSELFKFTLGADAVPLAASGIVTGNVSSQFAMDQFGDYFRVATTSGWGGDAASSVFVLQQAGDKLEKVGSVSGIAPGEQIFAARFAGERGYVVTFLQTDPLFTLDLSDPTNPKVAGELVIPGFSRYLHPIDATHLIGIGRGAPRGMGNGAVQLSLFDVSDIADPQRVAVYSVGGANRWTDSPAEHDHHAFHYFPETGVLAFPVTESDPTDYYNRRLEMLKVDPQTGFTRLGQIDHDAEVLRAVRFGDRVFSVGTDAIRIVDGEDPSETLGVIDL